MSKKSIFSRKNKREKRKKIIITSLVTVLVLVLIGGITYFAIDYYKSGKIFSKKQSKNIQQQIALGDKSQVQDESKTEIKKEEEIKTPLPTDVNKNSNTSIEGDKYTFSGAEVQRVNEKSTPTDGKKIVFLTFDDGPSMNNTPKILDILKANDVKATFFIMTKNFTDTPATAEILKRELLEGHAIGNHSASHDYKKLYPNRKADMNNIMEDFTTSNNTLKSILGSDFETKVIRFPGGAMSWKELQPVKDAFAAKGISYVDWNVDSSDAKSLKRSKDEIVAEVKKEVEANEAAKLDKITILMHDARAKEATVQALPEIITYLKAKGYEFRTLK